MRQRDVSVLILDYQGKILLQKRSASARRFPNAWGLFGGGVEPDEPPENALRREILEELELELGPLVQISAHPYVLPEIDETGMVYVFREDYRGARLALNEGQEMRWISPADALTLDLHPIYRRIIEEIVNGRVSVVS